MAIEHDLEECITAVILCDIDPERTAGIVAWQTAQLGRQWTESDFKLRPPKRRSREGWDEDDASEEEEGRESVHEADPGAENLLHLTLQFVGYAHRVEGRPYSRAELAREEMYSFIARRQAGELEFRESMFDAAMRGAGHKKWAVRKFKPYGHLLCPDRERLDRYVAGLLNGFNPRFYAAAAVLNAVPVWVRFLESQGLIDMEGRERTVWALQPLAGQVLQVFERERADPGLRQAIEECVEFVGEAGCDGAVEESAEGHR